MNTLCERFIQAGKDNDGARYRDIRIDVCDCDLDDHIVTLGCSVYLSRFHKQTALDN